MAYLLDPIWICTNIGILFKWSSVLVSFILCGQDIACALAGTSTVSGKLMNKRKGVKDKHMVIVINILGSRVSVYEAHSSMDDSKERVVDVDRFRE